MDLLLQWFNVESTITFRVELPLTFLPPVNVEGWLKKGRSTMVPDIHHIPTLIQRTNACWVCAQTYSTFRGTAHHVPLCTGKYVHMAVAVNWHVLLCYQHRYAGQNSYNEVMSHGVVFSKHDHMGVSCDNERPVAVGRVVAWDQLAKKIIVWVQLIAFAIRV